MSILKQKELFTDRLFNGDLEARGFLDVVHKQEHVWCLVLKDAETERRFVFHDYPQYDNEEVEDGGVIYTIPPRDGDLLTGIRFFYLAGTNGSKFAIHNLQTYDRPLIEKIWSKCKLPDECYIDTLIQSKIQYFDRKIMKGAKSGHSLENFARYSGDTHKPKVEDFSVMNAYMLHRCIMDVDIQEYCTNYLAKERRIIEHKTGITFDDAYKMEFAYARTCYEQETFGALVDRPHMEKCVEVWDERLHFLEDSIEPNLPPTVKSGSSTKITRKEMAVLMGFPKEKTDRMKEPTTTRKQNGEDVEVKLKPYAKPLTKWTNQKKANKYSGMHISYGFSPSFLKKKDLTDWIKENHPDTAPKDWEIEKEEVVTELVNTATCKYFDCEPEDLDLFGGMFTKVKFEASRLTQHEVVKGELIKSGIKFANEWNIKKDDNGMVKATEDTVVSYPPKASFENQLHYTVKKGEPLVTSPKFGEKEYDQLESEFGKQIGEYNTTQHRRRFLLNVKDPQEKGLIANIREDGRLPCGVFNSNTGTLRSTHKLWVNPPSDSALYGKEIRQSIIAPEGKILVSHDRMMSL